MKRIKNVLMILIVLVFNTAIVLANIKTNILSKDEDKGLDSRLILTNNLAQKDILKYVNYWSSTNALKDAYGENWYKTEKELDIRNEMNKQANELCNLYKDNILLQLCISYVNIPTSPVLTEEEYSKQMMVVYIGSGLLTNMPPQKIINDVAPYCELADYKLREALFHTLDMATIWEKRGFEPVFEYLVPYSNNPPKSLVLYLLNRDSGTKSQLNKLYSKQNGTSYDWYVDLTNLDAIQRNPYKYYSQEVINKCKTNQYNVIRETAVALENKYSLKYGKKKQQLSD